MAFLELDTKVEIFLHDGLVNLLPCPMSLAFDDIVQSIQSSLLLPDIDELWNTHSKLKMYLHCGTMLSHLLFLLLATCINDKSSARLKPGVHYSQMKQKWQFCTLLYLTLEHYTESLSGDKMANAVPSFSHWKLYWQLSYCTVSKNMSQ